MSVFLGRQPILDRSESIFGFELLFRSNEYINSANVDDDVYASFRTFINILQEFQIKDIVGNNLAFINANHEVISSDTLEFIPKNKFVIEILEDSAVDEQLIKRIVHLKNQGYIFALDDFTLDREYLDNFRVLLDKVSYIKVDIKLVDIDKLKSKINILKKTNAKLLAEKVETREEFELFKHMGFDYFQGYYFAKPDILKTESFDPSKLTILRIINMISKGNNVSDIIDIFKTNPDLSYSLLRFINSAAFCFKNRIKSIKHAITLLGMGQLRKWLLLLNYVSKGRNVSKSPLFQTAVIRAKVMENLSLESSPYNSAQADSAFFTGILSLLPVLFNVPGEEILRELSLDEDVSKAVLNHEGTIGKLLEFAIALEELNMSKMESLSRQLMIPINDISKAKLSSYLWLNKIIESF